MKPKFPKNWGKTKRPSITYGHGKTDLLFRGPFEKEHGLKPWFVANWQEELLALYKSNEPGCWDYDHVREFIERLLGYE